MAAPFWAWGIGSLKCRDLIQSAEEANDFKVCVLSCTHIGCYEQMCCQSGCSLAEQYGAGLSEGTAPWRLGIGSANVTSACSVLQVLAHFFCCSPGKTSACWVDAARVNSYMIAAKMSMMTGNTRQENHQAGAGSAIMPVLAHMCFGLSEDAFLTCAQGT